MSAGNILNVGDLAKPLVKLIESVRAAVGTLFEPVRIRRKAKAGADAAIILAKGRAKASDIEHRAAERLRCQEQRRQENIENITLKARDALPGVVSDKPVDPDWVHRFFASCQDIGNDQMQVLWSRLLAGEVVEPGSFSLRTLRIVCDLTPTDAQLFTSFCRFVWLRPEAGPVAVVPRDDANVEGAGVSFEGLTHLDTLGLITFQSLGGLRLKDASRMKLYYFGREHVLMAPKPGDLQIGCALLTRAGTELLAVAGPTACEDYRVATIERWRKEGWSVDEVTVGPA